MKKHIAIFTIIIIGLSLYAICLRNGFVWDDEEQIINNNLVHSLTNLPKFFLGGTFNTGGGGSLSGLYYKPIMVTVFSLLYSIFGPNPIAFHLFQITLHIANAILVFLIFKIFFKDKISLFLSIIFLIHPINVEAVAYSSALQDTLFLFFGLLSLNFVPFPKNKHQSAIRYMPYATLLLLSLFSKETGITFVFLGLTCASIFKKDKLTPLALGSIGAILLYVALRFVIAGIYLTSTSLFPISRAALFQRLINIPQIIFFYLKTFFFPKDLFISQHWLVKTPTLSEFYFPLLAVIISTLLVFLVIKKASDKMRPVLVFFLTWLILGLLLHLQVFPLDMTVAERWFYLPQIGLLGLLGAIITIVGEKKDPTKQSQLAHSKYRIKSPPEKIESYIDKTLPLARSSKVVIPTSIIIISLLFTRSFVRIKNWQNGHTLFSHDIKINKNAFDLENNLGTELFRNGDFREAETHFRKSTELAPYWWTSWNNLGVVFERKNETDKAKEYYQKAIDNGNYYLAFENLAALKFKTEEPIENKKFLEESLKKLPQNPKLWLILSLTEYRLGNKENAILYAQKSYQLQPSKDAATIITRLTRNELLEIK